MAEPEETRPDGTPVWRLATWHGLEAERDGVTYDADKLRKLAEDLDALLEKMTGRGAGSLSDLMAHTDFTDFKMAVEGVSRWPGGQVFAEALQRGHDEFTKVYQELITKLQIARGMVAAGAGIYGGADKANNGGA